MTCVFCGVAEKPLIFTIALIQLRESFPYLLDYYSISILTPQIFTNSRDCHLRNNKNHATNVDSGEWIGILTENF